MKSGPLNPISKKRRAELAMLGTFIPNSTMVRNATLARVGKRGKRRNPAIEKAKKLCKVDAVCERCGADGQLDAHHVIKVRHGATEALQENLMPLCRLCHMWAENNPSDFNAWFDSIRPDGERQRLHLLANPPLIAFDKRGAA